jgi:hypothetical protein
VQAVKLNMPSAEEMMQRAARPGMYCRVKIDDEDWKWIGGEELRRILDGEIPAEDVFLDQVVRR